MTKFQVAFMIIGIMGGIMYFVDSLIRTITNLYLTFKPKQDEEDEDE